MAQILAGFFATCLILYVIFLAVSLVLAVLGQVFFLALTLAIGIIIGLVWAAFIGRPPQDKDPPE